MCDIEGLIRDRDQLWAEAVARYKAQEPVYLSGHLEQLAMLEQAERLEPDDWEAPILTYVNAMKRDPAIKAMVPDLPWRDKITGLELMEKALHIRDKKDQTLTVTHRIGKIMRTLDWTRKKIRDDYVEGIPAWGYERTTPSGGGNTTGSSWPGQEEDCPEGTGREQDVPDAHGSGTASGTPDDPANMRSVPDVPDVPDNRAPIEEKTPTLDDTEGRDTGRRDKGASKISTKNVAEHGEHQEHRNNGPVTGGNAVPDVLQDQEQTVSSPHRVPVPPPPCPHERLEVQDGENICLDCGEVIDVWVF